MRRAVLALVLTLFHALPAFAAEPLADRLQALFERLPATRTIADARALGELGGADLADVIRSAPHAFRLARTTALARARPARSRHAVVSGLAITGLVAVAHLVRAGYRVDAFELRARYDRNIQWAARQALVDELATIDQRLADEFLERVARPLPKGSLHISETGRKEWPVELPRRGDPTRVPQVAEELMAAPSLTNLEARAFVEMMRRYVYALPGVTVHQPRTMKLTGPDAAGRYRVEGYGTPDLIVVAEGAKSDTRAALGLATVPASPAREQLAGAILRESGGIMSKHYHRAGSGALLLTGTMGRSGSGKTWVVADIAPGTSFDPADLPRGSPAFAAERQRRLDAAFRAFVAPAIEVEPGRIAGDALVGPFDRAGNDLEGPKPFVLQQSISPVVTAGTNVVLIGDAARAGHWSVGGGMQTGAVADAEALKRVLLDADLGLDRKASFARFSERIAANSIAWLKRGIVDFYPDMDRKSATAAFVAAERAWREGRAASPLAALERSLEPHVARGP